MTREWSRCHVWHEVMKTEHNARKKTVELKSAHSAARAGAVKAAGPLICAADEGAGGILNT